MFANFDLITPNGKTQPRGLHNFIADIRNSSGKDEERKRIDTELAKIRGKFTNSSNLSSYEKKKYILKMCYIFLLGYEVDFGHVEFIALLSSTKFSEKAVGYLAITLMLRPGDQLFTLLINSVSNDLTNHSKIHYFIKSLALNSIANINGPELSQALGSEIQPLIVAPVAGKIGRLSDLKESDFTDIQADFRHREAICKKASLALLAFYRLNPDCMEASEWVEKFSVILKDMNVSVIQSVMSLILGVAPSSPETFEPLVPYVIEVLQYLILNRQAEPGYMYYKIPSPWLQVKCLKFLQLYRVPEGNIDNGYSDGNNGNSSGYSDNNNNNSSSNRGRRDYQGNGPIATLYNCLQRIFGSTEITESSNKSNAEHAILFEAINLIMVYGEDVKPALKDQALSALGRFVNVKDANIRYLGLDALIRLARLQGCAAVQNYQEVVLESLKDLDISVRKRALDLIFVMTDRNNAEYIVGELVTNLAIAETAMKEDFVVKIAILAEKYPKNWNWYVDTLLRTILVAGDFVAEAVWHRIVQVVINHPDIHAYAAEKMFDTTLNKFAHDIAIALAGYLLGEIGENICTMPGKSGYDQFAALHAHFIRVSMKTQAILLTTYVKLVNLYPDTQDVINDVFNKYSTSNQLEIQQRSCEYLNLPKVKGDRRIMESVLDTMPAFPEDKSINSLYNLLNKDKDKENGKKGDADDSTTGGGNNNDSSSSSSSMTAIKSTSVPKTISTKSKEADLLSLDDDISSTPTSSSPIGKAIGIPSKVAPLLNTWYNEALVTVGVSGQKATIYEDDLIRVTVSAEYRLNQGRMTLFYYNKTGADILNIKAIFPQPLPYMNIRVQDPTNPKIFPSDEGRAMIAIDCTRPFTESPTFELSFSIGQAPYKYPLTLPVHVTSFFEPLPTDKDTYMNRWKSISGEGLEAQEIFYSIKPVNPQYVGYIRSTIFQGLHIGAANGLDNDNTATGSASFRAGADGNIVAVGVMVRLEGDAAQNRFRITIRGKHTLIVQGLKAVIKSILEKSQ